MMTKEQREESGAICDKATPGPWGVWEKGTNDDSYTYFPVSLDGPENRTSNGKLEPIYKISQLTKGDAAFIAHARTALPAALDALEESEAEYMGLLNELREEKAENRRLAAKNEQWDDADCNSCPLRTWSACEDICTSKLTMAVYISKLGNDIDLKLAALLEAEADRDRLKAENARLGRECELYKNMYIKAAQGKCEADARVMALERTQRGNCDYCIHATTRIENFPCCLCLPDCERPYWQLDEFRFAQDSNHT